MVDLNENNHLEIYLRSNKKEEPPSSTHITVVNVTQTFAISVAATMVLKITGILDLAIEISPYYPPLPPPIPPVEPKPPVGGGGGSPVAGNVQIDHCNGHLEAANFREYPDYEFAAINGSVRRGDWVTVTGETAYADGILWYKAINISPLAMSEDGYEIYYRPQEKQVGWIAACFVE